MSCAKGTCEVLFPVEGRQGSCGTCGEWRFWARGQWLSAKDAATNLFTQEDIEAAVRAERLKSKHMRAALINISEIGHASDGAGQFYAMLADKGLNPREDT